MLESIEKLRKMVDKSRYEYEQGNVSYVIGFNNIADEIEAEIAEKYMKLPVDIDGVPIHTGDYLKLGNTRGRVIALTYCPCNELPWEWQCDSDGDWYNTKFTRHAEPRTVEDVLRDFAYKVCDLNVADSDIERYSDELRNMLGGDN